MDREILDNLVTAVSNGRTDIVRTLLSMYETGTNPHGTNLSCEQLLRELCSAYGTLLHLATKLDHVDIVRTLLSSGAHVNIKNSMGETPLDLVESDKMTAAYVNELLECAGKSETDRICELVNAGVDVNSQDCPGSGNRALHWAVCFDKPDAVHCLLSLGASPNVVNCLGATPLHEAVKRKNTEIVKALLNAGADPTIKSRKGKYFGRTPLQLAEGDEELTNILLEYANKDSGSERSTNGFHPDHSVKNSIDDLSESLQSLSTISETPSKSNAYVPQPVQVPPFLIAPLPLITDSKLHLLWPQPQKIIQTDEQLFKLEQRYSVHLVQNTTDLHDVINVWEIHKEKFSSFGIECTIEEITHPVSKYLSCIVCHLSPQLFSRPESYKLVIANEQIRVLSSDVWGLHYALCTLEQLFNLYIEDGSLPSLYIHDWPHLQHRGVLLDFSRGARKPSVDTLKGYLKIMSSFKIRQLHCYFRYELNAENKLPFSNRDLIDISSFCRQHYINVIPAIDVGISADVSLSTEVSYLNIKEIINGAVDHLMPLFSSNEIQVGPNLSKIVINELFLTKNPKIIWDLLLLPSSAIIYLCCSSIQQNSEQLRNLLPLNCVLIEYGYQMEHDFDYHAKVFSLSGYNVCIGTGTTSWGSIAGCPETAISCIHKASQAALLYGSFGLLVADWKTLPHHPAFCFSWPGIVLNLGMAWNCSVHEDYLHARLPELLNLYVYQDVEQITGYLSVELGRLEAFMHQSIIPSQKDSSLNISSCQSSVLHQLLIDPDEVSLENFTFDLIQQVSRHVKKFELDLLKAKPSCFQHGEVISELRLSMDLLLFACRLSRIMVATGLNPSASSCGLAVINVGISNLPPIARTDIANKLLVLIEQFRAVWLSRNLPCGLETSLHMLNNLLIKLIPENERSLYSINGEVSFI